MQANIWSDMSCFEQMYTEEEEEEEEEVDEAGNVIIINVGGFEAGEFGQWAESAPGWLRVRIPGCWAGGGSWINPAEECGVCGRAAEKLINGDAVISGMWDYVRLDFGKLDRNKGLTTCSCTYYLILYIFGYIIKGNK